MKLLNNFNFQPYLSKIKKSLHVSHKQTYVAEIQYWGKITNCISLFPTVATYVHYTTLHPFHAPPSAYYSCQRRRKCRRKITKVLK